MMFRRELGTPAADGLYELTPFEVASELSYFVTDSAPDAELLATAASGALKTQAEIDRQAERLLATPRGKQAIARFVDGWLDVERLNGVVKDETQTQLSAELRGKMIRESEELFLEAFSKGLDLKQGRHERCSHSHAMRD